MAANPLLRSIQSAVKANDQIGAMFGRLGSSEHPNGVVLSAYRNANRAIRVALKEPSPINASREVLSQLKYVVRSGAGAVLDSSQEFGKKEADKQLGYYDILPRFENQLQQTVSKTNIALAAVIGIIDTQQTVIESMITAGIDPVMITGDEDRQGTLRAGDVLAMAAFWVTSLVWDAFSNQVERVSTGFQKQAIAALDGRTTDCCLKVHGQIQPFDGKFQLTGTPRFADELDWSPFHWRCRTSIALYLERFDDGLTDRMRTSANTVQRKRAEGIPWDQHPADAFVGK